MNTVALRKPIPVFDIETGAGFVRRKYANRSISVFSEEAPFIQQLGGNGTRSIA